VGGKHGGPSRIGKIFGCLCGLIFFVVTLATAQAPAQDLSGTEHSRLESQKSALFQQMLRNPANLDATFAYADVAARLGDYEAAVSALDRMLLFNPNLPRVQLEIGALYFRMGRTIWLAIILREQPPPIPHPQCVSALLTIWRRSKRPRHAITCPGTSFWAGSIRAMPT
jgi:tetratricopeptide (TPR) repeat protein